MRTTHTILILSLLATSDLVAQKPGGHWAKTSIPTTNTPPARHENPGAASKSRFYVFGGNSNASASTYFNDLWSFDGKVWKEETKNGATGSPAARHRAAICWDDTRNKLVVFGGRNGSSLFNDTWEWGPITKTWKNITPKSPLVSPSKRQFSSMAYDPSSKNLILFGGISTVHEQDTWALVAGALWIKQKPTTSPPARRQHHMVTRFDNGDILLCGGQNLSPTKVQFKDVWRFKSGQWTLIKPTTTARPATVVANNAFYDENRHRLNLSAGNWFAGGQSKNVQEFDSVANKWVPRGVDNVFLKSTRYFAGYIRNLGKAYKISGQNVSPQNTFVYESEKPPKSTVGSAGCSTGTTTPDLTNTPAWMDRTMVLEVKNTPTGAATLMGIGFAPAISVPLSVLGIGSANCVLTVNPLVVFPATPNTSGNAELSLPLPNTPSFAGTTVLIQALLTVGSTSYVSNRRDVTVGAL